MSNVETTIEAEVTDVKTVDPRQVYRVPVTKAGKEAGIDINLDDLPDNVYREVVAQGLKVVLNRGMTKITKETYPQADQLKAAALAKATETAANMKAGKIRIVGAKSDKVSGKVQTEARRIAKNLVKAEMKKQGIKVSYVDAKDITAAANALISANPEIVEMAKASIEKQEAEASSMSKIDIKALVPENSAKKAKVEAEKAKAKTQLSATQAGRVKPTVRQKPVNA